MVIFEIGVYFISKKGMNGSSITLNTSKLNFYILPGIVSCMAIAISEEIWFRSVLLKYIHSCSKNVILSVLIASAFFALFHTNHDLSVKISDFLIGIFLSVLVLRLNSIEYGIGIHFMWNLYSSYIVGYEPWSLMKCAYFLTDKYYYPIHVLIKILIIILIMIVLTKIFKTSSSLINQNK